MPPQVGGHPADEPAARVRRARPAPGRAPAAAPRGCAPTPPWGTRRRRRGRSRPGRASMTSSSTSGRTGAWPRPGSSTCSLTPHGPRPSRRPGRLPSRGRRRWRPGVAGHLDLGHDGHEPRSAAYATIAAPRSVRAGCRTSPPPTSVSRGRRSIAIRQPWSSVRCRCRTLSLCSGEQVDEAAARSPRHEVPGHVEHRAPPGEPRLVLDDARRAGSGRAARGSQGVEPARGAAGGQFDAAPAVTSRR